VANADWQRAISPTTCDGVNVRAADSASIDRNVDVTVFELLWLELREWSDAMIIAVIDSGSTHFLLLELSPVLLILDHEACESIWITHYDDSV
jgi:hypothetical protein